MHDFSTDQLLMVFLLVQPSLTHLPSTLPYKENYIRYLMNLGQVIRLWWKHWICCVPITTS